MREKFVKLAAASGNPIEPEMNPAAEQPADLPGSDEHVCPQCHGGGVAEDGMRCEYCAGTGKARPAAHSV
jgi:RecJ-like exonuclease